MKLRNALRSALLLALVAPTMVAAQELFTIQPLPRTDKEIKDRFTPQQLEILEKLNRRDLEHLIRTDPPVPGLIVPSAWQDDELGYSPLPREWPAAAGHAK